MSELLLINPKRRRRHAKARRRRRHVARARVHRRRRRVVAMAAPRRRRRRRHVARNPRRYARRRHVMHNRRRRRIRHNPFSSRGITAAIVPAGIGAMGAVALDVVWGYATPYLPAAISGSPYINALAKVAGAFGIGWAGSKVMGREKGKLITAGALTVIAYQLLEALVKQMAPSLPMAGLGAYMPLSGYNPAPYLLPGSTPLAGEGFGAYMMPMAGTTDYGPGASDSMF